MLIEDNAERPLSVQENYSCSKPPVMTSFEEISQELVSVQHAVDLGALLQAGSPVH